MKITPPAWGWLIVLLLFALDAGIVVVAHEVGYWRGRQTVAATVVALQRQMHDLASECVSFPDPKDTAK